jgi:chemotaxis-related protein WspB
MSEAPAAPQHRVLLFEIGGTAYALPISEVLEVAEVGRFWGVPTLPARVAGIMNHHGDPLPVVAREELFEGTATDLPDPQNVLLIGSGEGESGRLGVPVDRVLGLVDSEISPGPSSNLDIERRPVRGRIVAFVDARRLLEHASRAINGTPASSGAGQGGRE